MNENINFEIGPQASLTFEELASHGEPADPLPEIIQPEIYQGQKHLKARIILAGTGDIIEEEIYLKRLGSGCRQVYRLLEGKKPVRDVQHGGLVLFALQMKRVGGSTEGEIYQEPLLTEYRENLVAIKKQNLARIRNQLSRGHHENPFTAIQRMQNIGDNIHVLDCIEALKDNKSLYTIMPYCEGSILNLIIETDKPSRTEAMARNCIMKVWKDLHYLQERGIAHHDLSPDNIMLYKGNFVLTDLAMSLQIPQGPYQRLLLRPQGRFGKDCYLTPEVFMDLWPFDGFGLDVWSSGCILYNLLTGLQLYYQPHFSDVLFRYFIMARGLANEPLNQRTTEILVDVFQNQNEVTDQQNLLSRTMANERLSPQVMMLLQNILAMDPANRSALAQCMESTWAGGEEQ
mmetsp:Transcript_24469/g.26995  ORF Transcript_24469/g.26995 Transcript_24469/m.26995 type:complete len:402 (-) Transcript_24469:84-1289(-)|eukprot:CAMPEP_0194159704 /NCGR_PEP_ID=MMETSP0152-20130528/77987_1 /TAXON_ID=1049557 /ORGANISM="Thalassiothrix antarctica, Strain L6-D1" /LENGTH=401 /DNA_ID=CAMNT_0038869319 /DNA_START=314 /DNA_END=1519 /DNA_ORIENTATION=-